MVREQRFFDKLKLGALPTCVKDYAITYLDAAGEWKPLCSRGNNFLRHNIIRFNPVTTRSVRVEVEATNGDDLAKIFEIRVYNEQDDTLRTCC